MATVTEQDLITQTVRDYFEGWFDGDVARMDKALHSDLLKRSRKQVNGETTPGITTKERMLELTARGDGTADGADRTLDIEIHDVAEDIATATARSAVYHEYIHLVRTDDGWKISNTLWRVR